MGIIEAIFGKKREVGTRGLFALPAASIDMESDGLKYNGKAAVCYRSINNREFKELTHDIMKISGGSSRSKDDSYGYLWLIFEGIVDEAVAFADMVCSTFNEAGYGEYFLCAVFVFKRDGKKVYWVYNKRGKFYPFIPEVPGRNTSLEVRLKALSAEVLPVENALELWYPIDDLPV